MYSSSLFRYILYFLGFQILLTVMYNYPQYLFVVILGIVAIYSGKSYLDYRKQSQIKETQTKSEEVKQKQTSNDVFDVEYTEHEIH